MRIKILNSKIKIFLLTIIISLNCLVINAYTIYSPKIINMAKYSQSGNNTKALGIYKTLSNSEKDELVKYLEKYPEKFPPIFYILVADYIYATDKDKAVLWFYIGKIRSYQDVFMCKDKTSRGQLVFYPQMAPKTLQYMSQKSSDTKYTTNILQQSLDWDDAHPNRISPIWACYHGIEAYTKKPELVPKEEYPKIKKQIREQIETTIKSHKDSE